MRTIRTIARSLSVLCAALAVSVVTAAAQVPEKPSVPRAVNDFAGIFSASDAEYMNRVLVSFADSTSNRIVVVTVNDLGGMEPAMAAYEIGEQWGVGSSKFDNGVVVLVKPKTASSSGQVYIAVGYGLEGAIPDAIAKRIVENEMIPRFKENDYAGGVAAALNVLMRLSAGEISYKEYDQYRSRRLIGCRCHLLVVHSRRWPQSRRRFFRRRLLRWFRRWVRRWKFRRRWSRRLLVVSLFPPKLPTKPGVS